MKSYVLRITAVAMIAGLLAACGSSKQAKRGCPTNSASMGAERVLAGEKPQKNSKFKIKGMN